MNRMISLALAAFVALSPLGCSAQTEAEAPAYAAAYYAGQDSRAFQMLHKSIFQRLVNDWTGGTLQEPVWDYESFTRYEMIAPDGNVPPRDDELFYCTYSDGEDRHGYLVLRYTGDGIGKLESAETPYAYDLQANLDKIDAALRETALDYATARAARVRLVDAAAGQSVEAIRFTDGKGHEYRYSLDEEKLL